MIAKRQHSKGEHKRAEEIRLAHESGAGDERAQRRLAEQLFNRVRDVAHYLAAGDPEAEDYAQLAMIEILGAAGSYRGDSALSSWSERIAIRTVMRHIKRRRFRTGIVRFEAEVEVGMTESLESDVLRDRVSRRVTELLGHLRPKQRVTVFLKLIAGYSLEETAAITGASRHAVEYRLRKGRAHLARLIKRDPLLKEWIGEEGATR